MRQLLVRIHRTLIPPHTGLGWAPYVWLVYLTFLFVPFMFGRVDIAYLAPTIATVVVFLPLYFLGFRCEGARAYPVLGGIVLLGVVAAPWNQGASVYFVYAACFAPFAGPPREGLRNIGLIILVAALETWLLDLSLGFLWITAVVGGMVGIGNIFWRQMDIKNRALRASQEEVRRLAATAERERIARDLHDLLGHTLSVITLKSELAAKLAARDPQRAIDEMQEVERISRNALSEVRQAVSGYKASTVVGEVGRSRRALASAGIDGRIDLPRQFELSAEYDNLLGLVVREAVTNVVRHSDATVCRLAVSQEAGGTLVSVEDNGVGGRPDFGGGLNGMRERLEAVEGTLKIDAPGSGGLRLEAWIPHGRGDQNILGAPEAQST